MRLSRDGATVLEVCVVLATMGVLMSVVAMGLRRNLTDEPGARPFGSVIREAQRRAMRDQEMVTVSVATSDTTVRFTVRPTGIIATDGTIPSDSTLVTVLWEANVQSAH